MISTMLLIILQFRRFLFPNMTTACSISNIASVEHLFPQKTPLGEISMLDPIRNFSISRRKWWKSEVEEKMRFYAIVDIFAFSKQIYTLGMVHMIYRT